MIIYINTISYMAEEFLFAFQTCMSFMPLSLSSKRFQRLSIEVCRQGVVRWLHCTCHIFVSVKLSAYHTTTVLYIKVLP